MPEHSPAPTPARAVYGYVLCLIAYICLIMYLIWAYVPSTFLNKIGLSNLPQKHWAVTVPTYILTVGFIIIFCVYPGINFIVTPTFHSSNNILDENSIPWNNDISPGRIPPASDIPIAEVSEALYLKQKFK